MFKVILWEQLLRSERLDWISLVKYSQSSACVHKCRIMDLEDTLRNLNICGFVSMGVLSWIPKDDYIFKLLQQSRLHPALAHCYSQLPWIKSQVFSYNVFQLLFLCTDVKLMSPWFIAYTSPSFQVPRGGQYDTTIWRASVFWGSHFLKLSQAL